jgi:hypothetical protein
MFNFPQGWEYSDVGLYLLIAGVVGMLVYVAVKDESFGPLAPVALVGAMMGWSYFGFWPL